MSEVAFQVNIDPTIKRGLDIYLATAGINKKEFITGILKDNIPKRFLQDAIDAIESEKTTSAT